VPESERAGLLGELLLLEWTYRQQRGEGVEVEEYQQRFAGCREAVASAWRRWLDNSTSDATGSVSDSTVAPEGRPTEDPDKPIAAEVAHLPSGYTNLERLGAGGMGVVYRADDPRLGRKVALKQLKNLTPEGLERFRKEAMALARLQHPNVVQVFHLDEIAGEPLIVMEYVPGGSLEDRLKNGPLGAEGSAALVATLARAVASAHEAGVVHRDLKPSNVLMKEEDLPQRRKEQEDLPQRGKDAKEDRREVKEQGEGSKQSDSSASSSCSSSSFASLRLCGRSSSLIPKIADFGLARFLDDGSGQTLSGMVCGTPAYMSPE
jgi:serine/threonine protein kinase